MVCAFVALAAAAPTEKLEGKTNGYGAGDEGSADAVDYGQQEYVEQPVPDPVDVYLPGVHFPNVGNLFPHSIGGNFLFPTYGLPQLPDVNFYIPDVQLPHQNVNLPDINVDFQLRE